MRIIETNLSMRNNVIIGVQSRVVEINDWHSYISEIIDGKSIDRMDCLGTLHGNTLPKNCQVSNVIFDNKTLKCDVISSHGFFSKKIVYRIS